MPLSATHRPITPQGVALVLLVAAAFTLQSSSVLVAAHQAGGGYGRNHFAMFPGKATWGPSPMAGGSLAAGIGSPYPRLSSLLGHKNSKVLTTFSPGVKEVKVSFPSSSTAPRRSSLPAPAGYTVGAASSASGPLVMLRAGISGDSPYVLTRRRSTDSSRGHLDLPFWRRN